MDDYKFEDVSQEILDDEFKDEDDIKIVVTNLQQEKSHE